MTVKLVHALVDALRLGDEQRRPVDGALVAGADASSVAGAFAAGYDAALRALVPSLPAGTHACLCATEAGGAHPRAIATTLKPDGQGFLLDGEKRFVTGGPLADLLLVVATTGPDDSGRPRLRIARVDPHAPGVTMTEMPPLPFVPEIPHAEVRFSGVRLTADALLDGDGYTRYLKPFRTIEDLHVHAAVLAWVTSVAQDSGWPHEVLARFAALLAGTRALALADPSSAATHIALAGLFAGARALLTESDPLWARVADPIRTMWQRDRPLLSVAERARTQRTEAAFRVL